MSVPYDIPSCKGKQIFENINGPGAFSGQLRHNFNIKVNISPKTKHAEAIASSVKITVCPRQPAHAKIRSPKVAGIFHAPLSVFPMVNTERSIVQN